jgi:hypothetical protein
MLQGGNKFLSHNQTCHTSFYTPPIQASHNQKMPSYDLVNRERKGASYDLVKGF